MKMMRMMRMMMRMVMISTLKMNLISVQARCSLVCSSAGAMLPAQPAFECAAPPAGPGQRGRSRWAGAVDPLASACRRIIITPCSHPAASAHPRSGGGSVLRTLAHPHSHEGCNAHPKRRTVVVNQPHSSRIPNIITVPVYHCPGRDPGRETRRCRRWWLGGPCRDEGGAPGGRSHPGGAGSELSGPCAANRPAGFLL